MIELGIWSLTNELYEYFIIHYSPDSLVGGLEKKGWRNVHNEVAESIWNDVHIQIKDTGSVHDSILLVKSELKVQTNK